MKDIEKLVDAVIRTAFIPLEASGRHVHVTREQALADVDEFLEKLANVGCLET